jgi:hypothetical protein
MSKSGRKDWISKERAGARVDRVVSKKVAAQELPS